MNAVESVSALITKIHDYLLEHIVVVEIISTVTCCILILIIYAMIDGPDTRPSKKLLEKRRLEKLKTQKKQKPVGPFTPADVAMHNKSTDAWIIVDGKVYDVTEFVDEHPGGDAILRNVGGDSSVGMHGPQHADSVWDVLNKYYIGDLKQ